MQLTKKAKALIIAGAVVLAVVIILVSIMGAAVAKSKKDQTVASGTLSMLGNLIRNKNKVDYQVFDDAAEFPVEKFRVSMSAMNHWENVDDYDYADYQYTYKYTLNGEEKDAGDLKGLQEMFNAYGATEMYVRINTTRHSPQSDVNDFYHARMHCLDESLKACQVAVELGMPINVEVGCFAGYSDAFESQYPDFSEYTDEELGITYPRTADGVRKEWKDMTIEEICLVLKGYGKFLATQVKAVGADVEYWDLGNETNYGFGGVMMPLKSAVSKATSKQFWITYLKKNFGADWLAKNIWCYNGQMFAALKAGIVEVYPAAKFSSHISTVTWGADYTVKYFKTLAENGYMVDQAGISYYPNATGVILDKIAQIKQIVLAVNRELHVNVMLAEYGYANETGLASGTFASWNNEVHGYKLTDEDGAKFLKELITWGRKNGMAGIRPWAPELDWANPWFDFDNTAKTATAKQVLFDALKEAVQ
ncbi:MAG: glycosyl hydrolase 53 family protein [Clostridia bacterium]|nr:glycosyl hydrolase 53 family protein [Clostridia bacterium]